MSNPTNPINSQTIEVTVSPAGETTVRTRGFSGPGCRDVSRFIEQALGDRTAEVFTPEYFQPAAAGQKVGQG